MVSSNLAPPNGQELLSEFMQYGRQGPFEEIVRRYAGMVFNVCLRVTKDKHDAEDATQAVFLTLAIQARRGTQVKALGPWLQQVAKRLSLDLRRSKSRRKVREERHQVESEIRHSGNGDSFPQADLDEIKIILHEELNKLPSKYRLPLILHYFGGMSREEMAEELGCKPSTLGVRIFRGREMLAGRLNGRGINMSSGTFAVALTYTIHSAVSNAMVSSVSHAASAVAVGHDGIGLLSSRVIGLSRRAASAMVLGKLKLAAMVLVLACTALGTGAKAFGMLPKIDIGQIISNEVMRLIRPLAQPLTMPLRVDAGGTTGTNEQVATKVAAPEPAISLARNWQATTAVKSEALMAGGVPSIAVSEARPAPRLTNFEPSAQAPSGAVAIADSPAHSGTSSAVEKAGSNDDDTPVTASAGGGGGSGGGGGYVPGGTKAPAVLASRATPAFAYNGMPVLSGAAAVDLFVSPPLKASVSSGKPSSSSGVSAVASTASPGSTASSVPPTPPAASTSVSSVSSQLVRIPAEGGSVINSAGMLSGYGKVDMTGTLDVCGQVVANGQGTDRTLNLTSFGAILDSDDSAPGGAAPGWYAQDHGRLVLRLQPSQNGTSLEWGEDPADPTLNMVNAVRLSEIETAGNQQPVQLSLLAADRDDIPSLSTLDGVPVGLWEIDPSLEEIDSAELTIRYNDAAVLALGDSESELSLWTLGDGSWEPVDPSGVTLDTEDHTISGVAEDFQYFAVAAPVGNGADISNLIAVPNNQFAPTTGQVPEPVGLGTLALLAGLLGRRRRR